MDTFGFWLPLILLFISALIGAVIKRRACDHCLKKFEANKILLFTNASEWICGKLEVFAQGIELQITNEHRNKNPSFRSRIIHSTEVEKFHT